MTVKTKKQASSDEGGTGQRRAPAEWARNLFDSLQNDLAVFLCDGRIVDINQNGLAMLGMDQADQALGTFFAEYIFPDHLPKAAEALSAKTPPGKEIVVQMVPSDASEPFDVAISSLKIGTEGIAIRARRVRTIAQKQQGDLIGSNLYQYLFESSQAMICVLDHDGYILLSNEAAWRILGYTSAVGLSGRPFLHIVHPDYHNVIEMGLDVFADEKEPFPLKFLAANADIIDADVKFSPIGDGQYMLEARDITERTRTAEVLQEREQRLRGILNTVADAIITINIRGEVVAFNKAAEHIFGYEAREVVGHTYPC